MSSLFTKWGSLIVLAFVVGTIVMVFASGVSGLSSWLGDSYLPKKYLIVEKYPIRIILYGQFADEPIHARNDNNYTGYKSNRFEYILKAIEALDKTQGKDGNFPETLNINVNSDFNSKQIRSSNRADKLIQKGDQTNAN